MPIDTNAEILALRAVLRDLVGLPLSQRVGRDRTGCRGRRTCRRADQIVAAYETDMFLAQRAHQVRTEARSGWEMRPLVNRRPSDFQD
jgi:hypothetical protein